MMQQTLGLRVNDPLPPLDKRFAKHLHIKLLAELTAAIKKWPSLSEDERTDWLEWVENPLPRKNPGEGFSRTTMMHLQAIAEQLQYAATRSERFALREEMQIWMAEDGAYVPFSFAMCLRYEAVDIAEMRGITIYNLHKLDAGIPAYERYAA